MRRKRERTLSPPPGPGRAASIPGDYFEFDDEDLGIAPDPYNEAQLQADAAQFEARVRRGVIVGMPTRASTTALRAEIVHRVNYGALHHVHLMQRNDDVEPMMGRVHMVSVGDDADREKHFMFDMHGDINEGQKIMVERARARRGPFKDRGGRSTVMDRSAHIIYRKRGGAFEITVRRGAIQAELQQLLSKLSMHRMSIADSYLVIIKGSKRVNLGRLSDMNLHQLLQLIDDCVDQYGTCGLEITEQTAGSGALYKQHVHAARFKNSARRKHGPAARRRRRPKAVSE